MALLDAAYAGVARAATSLGQDDWARPTRAVASTVLALLHHELTDAQRAWSRWPARPTPPPTPTA